MHHSGTASDILEGFMENEALHVALIQETWLADKNVQATRKKERLWNKIVSEPFDFYKLHKA